MLTAALSFLPCITCLFWLVLNPLIRKADQESKTLELLLAVMALATVPDVWRVCGNDIAAVSIYLSKQFFAVITIPSILAYIRVQTPALSRNSSVQAWLAVPVALIFAQIILIMLIGPDDFISCIRDYPAFTAAGSGKEGHLIQLCTVWIYDTVLAIQFLLLTASVIRESRENPNAHLFNCLALSVIFILQDAAIPFDASLFRILTPLIWIILSIAIYYTSYYDLFRSSDNYSFKVLLNDISTNNRNEGLNKATDSAPASGKPADGNSQMMADEDSLRIRFEDLIVTEQLFLKQGIRISDIAAMLETNRTYISRLVNNTYNMSFSDYINTLRIDYAEQYLLHHRDARQSDLAAACGFPNASAFNNVFKKITGVTPKKWLATKS